MKLPALAIVAAFASGIALGLHPAVAPRCTSPLSLSVLFLGALVLIVAGLFLARAEHPFPASGISLLS